MTGAQAVSAPGLGGSFRQGHQGDSGFQKDQFVDADLSTNLLRRPMGEWICLDAQTFLDGERGGLAQSHLLDEKPADQFVWLTEPLADEWFRYLPPIRTNYPLI